MKIKFCGAAKIVTGSCYLITVGKYNVLVDCGMYQGRKETTRMNYDKFAFDPKKIDILFLTHAHIDHTGLVPKLVKQGFTGAIYATGATIDLAKIMLADSAHIQMMDVKYENIRRQRQGFTPRQPLYNDLDAKESCKLMRKISYGKTYEINDNIKVRYNDAGHIIGSASIEMWLTEKGINKKIVFSGDIGQWDVPIVNDPTLIEDADYVLIESTYGNRLHDKSVFRDDLLLKYALETFKKGGKLMIPSFAIERTQELLYSFNKLIKAGKFPKDVKIFLDSPLAIKATDIFKKHAHSFDEEATKKYPNWHSFKSLVRTCTAKESIAINSYDKPCVIIAGSGMANAGRIRHHFKNGIWDPKNTVCFVGYQAKGTLGRIIIEGAKNIKMMGQHLAVKADIKKINGFSAHADYNDLIKWAKGFKTNPHFFIIHGEPDSQRALKVRLLDSGFKKSSIPTLYKEVEL